MQCDSRCELISVIRDLNPTESAAVQCNRSEEDCDMRDAQGLSAVESGCGAVAVGLACLIRPFRLTVPN